MESTELRRAATAIRNAAAYIPPDGDKQRDDIEAAEDAARDLERLAEQQDAAERRSVDYVARGIDAMRQAAHEAASAGADDVAEMCAEWTENDHPSDPEDAITERINEFAGSAVTYTRDAIAITVGSDNDGAAFDVFGSDVFADSDSIPWDRLAFSALEADIRDGLPLGSGGPNGDGHTEWWAWRAWARKRRDDELADDSETFEYDADATRLDCQRCDATIEPVSAPDDPEGVEHCDECGARHVRETA